MIKQLADGRYILRPLPRGPIRITAQPSGAVLFEAPDAPREPFSLDVPAGEAPTLQEVTP